MTARSPILKQITKIFLLAIVSMVLFGCAHPIALNPDMEKINNAGGVVIDRQVGYHIPDAARTTEVTTAGGGGDKVRYFPYRDLEAGFYKALSSVFKGVTKVADPKDSTTLAASGVTMLIIPEITTTSFSDSVVTWPPTQFTVTLNCRLLDVQGQELKAVRVQGEGRATFDEFKGNLSLAAVRASDDSMVKLVKALAERPDLRR